MKGIECDTNQVNQLGRPSWRPSLQSPRFSHNHCQGDRLVTRALYLAEQEAVKRMNRGLLRRI